MGLESEPQRMPQVQEHPESLPPFLSRPDRDPNRGSFKGGIPASNPRPGSVGRQGSVSRQGSVGRAGSSASSATNARSSLGRQQENAFSPPPLRSQRSALALIASGTGRRARFVIWLVTFYHQHKRYLRYLWVPPVLDPRCNGKLFWDTLIMVIVLYSAVIVPVQIGFPEVELGSTASAIAVASDTLFLLDVAQNFFVGYYVDDDDLMVRDRRRIAKRYLSSWFLPDILAIIPVDQLVDGGSVSAAETGSGADGVLTNHHTSVLSLRLARLSRLLRVAKLTRLIKLRHFAMKVEDAFDLDAVLARLTRLIGQVLLVTHVLACFWHLLGYREEYDTATSWIITAGLQEERSSVRYLYSFYWVVASVAGVGYGDVHAMNTDERLFAMATALLGACGFGLIIGNLTKILENWNRETTTRMRKLSMVQAFVRKKRLPRAMKVRLMRYFRHYIAKTSAFDERELLCEFSLSLRGEILHDTYKSTFFKIPAFKRLSPQFVLDMAMFIKPLIVVKGDVLAREGGMGTEMFILNSGIVEIRRTASENIDWVVVLEVLTENAVLGEASLLYYAPHANTYTAKATSDLYTLPKEDFDRLIEEFPDAERALLCYHQERTTLYDYVFEQTLARYRVFVLSRNNDPVSQTEGLENLYPTLTVLLDGVLCSYRSVPLPILHALDLDLSMGVSVFNSVTEKSTMVALLSADAQAATSSMPFWQRLQWHVLTPISPLHRGKLAWDTFMSSLLLYCALIIPYEATFLIGDGSVFSAEMDQFVEFAFGLDVLVSFRTAQLVDVPGGGHATASGRRTRWREYLYGWFCVDFLSALPISVIVSFSAEHVQNDMGYASWVLILVRSLRLLKLSRVLRFVHTLQHEEGTTALGAAISAHHSTTRLVRLIVRVSFIAHLLTCGFFLVASLTREDDERPGLEGSLFTNHAHGDIYVYFLYWAVTTMTTVGYGDTPPLNNAEVAYVACGVLIGASTFTYVVGTLSSIVEELHETSETFRSRMDHLKAYLRERNIAQPLAARLRRYYEYYLLQRDDENEEVILSALSDDLRGQLVLHLNRDVVSKISFFATQDDACVSYLMGILDPEFCTPGEYVFKEGQVGRHMYFLIKGVAEVLFKAETSEEQVVATLLEGSYFGEIAMLTRSKRGASIRAKTYANLFVLSLHGLDRISMHYPEMANSILQEFRNKITHIKKTSVKQLGSLVQEDIKQARERSGLLNFGGLSRFKTAASNSSSSSRSTVGTGSSYSVPELHASLVDLEIIVKRIVGIYGGDDRGKRKALTCVMQHLRKYEFSIDDFLLAAEELDYVGAPQSTGVTGSGYADKTVLNSLQMRMRRRSSFS